MARNNSKDYIPTYADREHERAACEARAQAARDRGYRLGEYEITYTVNGRSFTEKATASSRDEAIQNLKRECGMVGWIPANIQTKTLVEPNIYV